MTEREAAADLLQTAAGGQRMVSLSGLLMRHRATHDRVVELSVRSACRRYPLFRPLWYLCAVRLLEAA